MACERLTTWPAARPFKHVGLAADLLKGFSVRSDRGGAGQSNNGLSDQYGFYRVRRSAVLNSLCSAWTTPLTAAQALPWLGVFVCLSPPPPLPPPTTTSARCVMGGDGGGGVEGLSV